MPLAQQPLASEFAPKSVRPVRVVLANDHAAMRRSLRLLLDVEVIGEAGDLTTVVSHVHGFQPQVLILDLGMHNGSSIEAIRRCESKYRVHKSSCSR